MSTGLRSRALTSTDTASSTLANIGPAFSIYVTIGAMAQLGGYASVYAIILAGGISLVLSGLLGSYAHRLPVAGSYVQYVYQCLGQRFSTLAALMIFTGTIFEFGAVSSAIGRFASAAIARLGFAGHIPYPILSGLMIALAVVLVRRGVKLAVRWTIAALAFEIAALTVFVIFGLIHGAETHAMLWVHLNPDHIPHLLTRVAASFPVVFFLFMGWDNSASLAEETVEARQAVRRSAVMGTVLSGILYLLTTVTVLMLQSLRTTASEAFPFANISEHLLFGLVGLIFLSSVTSTFGALLAMVNARSRILFGSGRSQVLPARLSQLSPSRTPAVSIYALAAPGSLIMLGGYFLHLQQIVGLLAGVGTLYFMMIYSLTAFLFPVFIRKCRERIRPVRHVVLPYLVGLVLLVPMYATLVPGPLPSLVTVAIVLISLALFVACVLIWRPAELR